MPEIEEAKKRLDLIIKKGRVDLYKPIQIAEVLKRARIHGDIEIERIESFKNQSLRWRDEVTKRLLGKRSTSSAQYQHNVWNENAMQPDLLASLDSENRKTGGLVERYIYMRFSERQETVGAIIAALKGATPASFNLKALLDLFVNTPGIRRSIDKAYEVVAYAVFETVVSGLAAKIKVHISPEKSQLLAEFSDLAERLLGLRNGATEWEELAHIYRVGVTNAADRGLDMWSNFGPAIQVKHLTLDDRLAQEIVDRVEGEHIVVVCKDADAAVIKTVTKQIGWGKRVRGVVTESDLAVWYEKCLRGNYASVLAVKLLETLREGFISEFPQVEEINDFLSERGYVKLKPTPLWITAADATVASAGSPISQTPSTKCI